MAKGKINGDETPSRPRTGTRSTTRDKSKPERDITGQEVDDPKKSGSDGENPDWWRGDPGRRGEVL